MTLLPSSSIHMNILERDNITAARLDETQLGVFHLISHCTHQKVKYLHKLNIMNIYFYRKYMSWTSWIHAFTNFNKCLPPPPVTLKILNRHTILKMLWAHGWHILEKLIDIQWSNTSYKHHSRQQSSMHITPIKYAMNCMWELLTQLYRMNYWVGDCDSSITLIYSQNV